MMMRPSDVKVGLVYRYRRLGELFVVLDTLPLSHGGLLHGVGAHVWLKLTGHAAGLTGVERGLVSTLAEVFWMNYQIPDFDSSSAQ